MKEWVFAVTGASGAPFAVRLLRELLARGDRVHLVLSTGAAAIVNAEAGLSIDDSSEARLSETLRAAFPEGDLAVWSDRNLHAPVSSGSHRTDGMFIVPCSMKTLGAVAHGLADNLVTRAADVCLKEGRRLVLCPRETPLNAVHLENMMRLARLGVRIVPPVPAFYTRPETLADMIDFVAGKLLDAAGVENELYRRWDGREA